MINFNDTIYQPTVVSNQPQTSQSQVSSTYTAAVREQRNNFNCIKNEKNKLKKRELVIINLVGINFYNAKMVELKV